MINLTEIGQNMTGDGDRFYLREGARRVKPSEFTSPVRGNLTLPVICEALQAAAAPDGSLLNFDMPTFYTTHIQAVLEGAFPLHYDTFVAGVLMDYFLWLQEHGYLAHRGNGDSFDYWLACPAQRH